MLGEREITGDLLVDLLVLGDRSTGEISPDEMLLDDELITGDKMSGGEWRSSFTEAEIVSMVTCATSSASPSSKAIGGRVLWRNFLLD